MLFSHDVNFTKPTSPRTVLAIDDEPEILNLFRAALESRGFIVHTASSPREGIAVYQQQWQDIQLVLMDFMMPEMTGDLLLQCLQQINPGVRVMLVTGSYARGENRKFEEGLAGYIQKPFDLDLLAQHVGEIIDASDAAPLTR